MIFHITLILPPLTCWNTDIIFFNWFEIQNTIVIEKIYESEKCPETIFRPPFHDAPKENVTDIIFTIVYTRTFVVSAGASVATGF